MSFQKYTLTLAANQSLTPSINGTFVNVFEASAPFKIKPRSATTSGGATFEVEKGLGFSLDTRFSQLEITNGATPQTIELYAGMGDIRDIRLISSGGTRISGNINGTNGVDNVDSAAKLILAKNDARASVLFINTSSQDIYLGTTNTVTTANGIPIKAGQTFNCTLQSDLYFIAATNGNEVRYLEESN